MRERIWQLFTTFFKIGAFTFGGGYAMIPLIQREIVDTHHWMRKEDILDIVAVAESTPGPIAINSATFTGYKVAGFKGALAATCGVTIPSFLIFLLLGFILGQIETVSYVRWAFSGIRAAVLALIIHALYTMYRACPKTSFSHVIMLACLIGVGIFKVGTILVLLLCAAAGIVHIRRKEGSMR